MSRAVVVCVVALVACPAVQPPAQGDSIYQAYPFDDLREWTFQAEDTTVPYRLMARQLEGFEEVDEAAIYTIEFIYDCFNDTGVCVDADEDGSNDIELTTAFTWKMSSTRRDGVRFHAISDVAFDPPIVIADGAMRVDEEVVTTSGGVTYTATYPGKVVCPAPGLWPDEESRPDCYENVVDDGGADSLVGGTYWSTTRVSLVAFEQGDGILWQARAFDVAE